MLNRGIMLFLEIKSVRLSWQAHLFRPKHVCCRQCLLMSYRFHFINNSHTTILARPEFSEQKRASYKGRLNLIASLDVGNIERIVYRLILAFN